MSQNCCKKKQKKKIIDTASLTYLAVFVQELMVEAEEIQKIEAVMRKEIALKIIINGISTQIYSYPPIPTPLTLVICLKSL